MNMKKSISCSIKKTIKPRKPFGEKKAYCLIFLAHMFDAKMTIQALKIGAVELNPFLSKMYSLGWDIFLISKIVMVVLFIFLLAKIITYRKHELWRFGAVCAFITGLIGGLSGVYTCFM